MLWSCANIQVRWAHLDKVRKTETQGNKCLKFVAIHSSNCVVNCIGCIFKLKNMAVSALAAVEWETVCCGWSFNILYNS